MRTGNSIKNNLRKKFEASIQFNIVILPLIILILFGCKDNRNLKLDSLSGTTMGTTYSVKILREDNVPDSKDIQISLDSILAIVNQQMSTYISDSEISKFNSSFDTSWTSVSDDFAFLLAAAKSIAIQSEGFYDITVGPVVNLWGFGPEAIPLKVPSETAILKAKNRTGINKIKIDTDANRIKKLIPDLYIDLSSIAKGFGVDKVAQYLEDIGISEYLVEIGGEVRTKGKNIENNKWRIGISTPLTDDLQKILSISGMSVATSGDYMNYFEKEGVRYSHLIDPQKGKPISHSLASVTVISEDCLTADAYATAINIMGPEYGYDFAMKMKLPVFLIVREGNDFIEKMTPFFEEFIERTK